MIAITASSKEASDKSTSTAGLLENVPPEVFGWAVEHKATPSPPKYERMAVTFDQDNDFDTMNVKAKGYERYSFGWSDPRALFGSNGP